MNHLAFLKRFARAFFHFTQTFVQIGCRYFTCRAGLHLYQEYRIHMLIVLFLSIVVPMEALVLPFVGCSLEYSQVFVYSTFFWIVNLNNVLQQSRLTHLFRSYNHLVQS